MDSWLLRGVVARAFPPAPKDVDDQWRQSVDALHNFITETQAPAFDCALKSLLVAQTAPDVAAVPAETAPQDPLAAICSRASCCLRINSIRRPFLQGPRPIHERSKTTLCTARAPPRRRFGSRVRETRSGKSYAFSSEIVATRRRLSSDL